MKAKRIAWVINTLLPTGERVAFAEDKERFALVEVINGEAPGAMCWGNYPAAETYLKAQVEQAPALKQLRPFIIERMSVPLE